MFKKRRIITLIGVNQATKNFKFLFSASSTQCEKCEYHKVCIENLEQGRVYQVVRVLQNVFPCPLHEEGVRAVEVVEADIIASIPSKLAVEGATIVFKAQECGEVECKNAVFCNPKGLLDGDKCIVVKIERKLRCVEGFSLVKALLRRFPFDKSQ